MTERVNQGPSSGFSTDYRLQKCSAAERPRRSWLLEQFFGCRAVGADPLDMCFDPRDLGLQELNPLLEFFDRYRIEVLLGARHRGGVGLAAEVFVEVHGSIVDRYS